MKKLLTIVSLLVLLGIGGRAEAFPHYQYSSDSIACSLCHYAPAGGGLLTPWGREEAGNTLSMGGNGDFLHGAIELPESLSLGGDFRAAALLKDKGEPEGAELLFFPMQADLAARFQQGAISASATLGLRGQARQPSLGENNEREEGGVLSRIVSREHYLQYQAQGSKLRLRAGRFYAPYGLRLPDHTSYIRRYVGFNVLDETYNLSSSYRTYAAETHVSAHVSDALRGRDEIVVGMTAMHERQSDLQAVGAGVRVTRQASELRALVGSHLKRWLPGSKLLLVAELDAGYQRFEDAPENSRMQLVGHVGPVWFPVDGVSTSLAYEFFDEDVRVKHLERHALTSWVSILPWAHLEVLFLGRAERIGPSDHILTGMMQLHYYL